MTVRRCLDCAFFFSAVTETRDGVCRRFPPMTLVAPEMGRGFMKSEFPSLKQDGWCGEFKDNMKFPVQQS